MTHDFIHLESKTGFQCVVRLSFISFAMWQGEDLLVFTVGDNDPLSVTGEQAQKLWTLLRGASLSMMLPEKG
ncbi:hypothetical protein [Nostoc sp. NMS4]|uniref:hypothetical protein n=1 Tax=Nostoc sp. NMS4 TaxID=2815390 RepID=UPI0025F1431C|nr:hypothetical protein [Nostoc sp. NMS4]MBN3924022.1 hypothetical protein [Nostoc sp. NMS4]